MYIILHKYQILAITRRIPFPPVATRPRVVRKAQPPPVGTQFMSRPEADHFGPGLVQARGETLRTWARSRPNAARFRPGSVEARGGPFWAWARPGPSRFSAGLERSRPTAARPGSGRIQARGRLLRAWFRPGPRRTGPGLDPSRCQGSSSKPCHVGPRGLLHPRPRWWGTQNLYSPMCTHQCV